jgi:hypothetical protein
MRTMHTVLLVGPYDWQPELLPEEEFRQRIAAFWQAMPDASISGALVYADTRRNGELVYFTGFTPKVRHAMALIPRAGEPVVLAPGTRASLSSARKLTWVKNVGLLPDPAKALAEWREQHGGSTRIALLGGARLRRPMIESLAAQAELVDASETLRSVTLRKRPRELELMRRSCAILADIAAALKEAHRSGANVTAAVIKAEREGYRRGAQDVQILFSPDGGGTLRPYEVPVERRVDPLQAWIAVRCAGYWCAGFVRANEGTDAAFDAAQQALNRMLETAKAGTTAAQLEQAGSHGPAPFRPHPLIAGAAAVPMGLALDEPSTTSLVDGAVYSLRAGVTDGERHGLASAVIAVNQKACEVLWKS